MAFLCKFQNIKYLCKYNDEKTHQHRLRVLEEQKIKSKLIKSVNMMAS